MRRISFETRTHLGKNKEIVSILFIASPAKFGQPVNEAVNEVEQLEKGLEEEEGEIVNFSILHEISPTVTYSEHIRKALTRLLGLHP
jgi:hypothetical protein